MNYDHEEYIDHKIANVDFTGKDLSEKVFANCIFKECNFLETNLTETELEECSFIDCSFSNPEIDDTRFNTVYFEECKLVGLSFQRSNHFRFNVSFSKCFIHLCDFYHIIMNNTKFDTCEIIESYFQNTSLVGTLFDNSFFKGTLFNNANLEKASFYNAKGYNIDPTMNKIKEAIFSYPDVINLLDTFDIIIKDSE